MAKSKRSRRARRQQTAKQKQAVVPPAIKEEVGPRVEEPEPAKIVEETPVPRNNIVDFAQEYFYVYTELRNILIVAIIMFIVMTGLAYLV